MTLAATPVDAIVTGAGFGGLYMIHLLRRHGFGVQGFERGADVGGTWYWNRYPGCRCDVESMEYSYQFDDDLQQDWEWPERYSAQPDILAYARHVADRFDLRPSIRFGTSVLAAHWDAATARWTVTTDNAGTWSARYLVMATGCLSTANTPDFPGLASFRGRTYHTGQWPHEGVDFSGQHVGIIGTGSSAVQSIPLIAPQAQSLTVFQRTPNYSMPARNRPLDPAEAADIKRRYADLRARNKLQPAAFGADHPRNTDSVFDVTPEVREQRFEQYWNLGGFMFMLAFGDLVTNPAANEIAADFVRRKIRATVRDPATAELLCPTYALGCKRLCADSGYFETFNRPNVHLVDVARAPIERLTPDGLVTGGREYRFDAIIFATGFDAMTGSLLRIDLRGRDGQALRDKWQAGPRSWLGLATAGFPNLFMMTGPGSPSVLANMVTGVEHHAEYIVAMLDWARRTGVTVIDADPAAEDGWVQVVNQRAEGSVYLRCDSWYVGANVPGKPRVFMPYIGFPAYVERLRAIAEAGYEGFRVA